MGSSLYAKAIERDEMELGVSESLPGGGKGRAGLQQNEGGMV